MNAVADDYEDLEHVVDWASRLLSECGIVTSRPELVQTLQELTREGLAQAYVLSPVPPYTTVVPFKSAESGQLWFYLTPDGLDLLRRS